MKRAIVSVVGWFRRERNRAYLYRLATASGGVATAYGWATDNEVALWAGLVATAFGLPAANTSTKRDTGWDIPLADTTKEE